MTTLEWWIKTQTTKTRFFCNDCVTEARTCVKKQAVNVTTGNWYFVEWRYCLCSEINKISKNDKNLDEYCFYKVTKGMRHRFAERKRKQKQQQNSVYQLDLEDNLKKNNSFFLNFPHLLFVFLIFSHQPSITTVSLLFVVPGVFTDVRSLSKWRHLIRHYVRLVHSCLESKNKYSTLEIHIR